MILPHRVVRTHLGIAGGNPTAFATIVQAQPFPAVGRPVRLWSSLLDYDPVILRKPFRFHLTVDTLSSGSLLRCIWPFRPPIVLKAPGMAPW